MRVSGLTAAACMLRVSGRVMVSGEVDGSYWWAMARQLTKFHTWPTHTHAWPTRTHAWPTHTHALVFPVCPAGEGSVQDTQSSTVGGRVRSEGGGAGAGQGLGVVSPHNWSRSGLTPQLVSEWSHPTTGLGGVSAHNWSRRARRGLTP